MKGYFCIGAEGISKVMNVGSLFRSAHAFGASMVFTVAAVYQKQHGERADTSKAPGQVPFYSFPDVSSMALPQGCSLIGVEITDDAVELPSFRHPRQAAYIFGPERGILSPAMLERCDHVVKIPTRFSVNVGIAGAILMYDRVLSLGRFAERPGMPGGPTEQLPDPVFGAPKFRRAIETFRDSPPEDAD